MAGVTVIQNVTPEQFAGRIADLFPPNWASDDAKASGNAFALLLTVGQKLTDLLAQVQYLQSAARIPTETTPELDNAGLDFFGGSLPRPGGMADADYATLILSSLFKPAATRKAISDAITQATGQTPRMVEPWNVTDTGARDTPISFRDVDTAANPMRNTNPGLRCQGFIDAVPPIILTLKGNPLIARDATGYRDANEYRISIQSGDTISIFDTINSLRAAGITIWVRVANITALSAVPETLNAIILGDSILQ
jgi:hypothetical protein